MRTCLALLWIGLLAGFAAAQEDAPTPPPGEGTTRPASDARTIAALIRQLGDNKWAVREAATRELAKIGAPALPAVRRAMLSNDLEVRARAKIIYQEILDVMPKRVRASRAEMLEAFDKGDYTKAIRIGERLTSSEGGGLLDWLRLGHASQLAGQWGSAVKAYQQVVGLIDADLAAGKMLVPDPKADSGMKPVPLNDTQKLHMLRRRTSIAVWTARMQMDELKDPAAAADGLDKAVKLLEGATGDVAYLRGEALKELTRARAAAGPSPELFAAWAKLHEARLKDPRRRMRASWADVERMGRAISALPAGKPIPDIPMIFVLTPDRPGAKLMLDTPATRDQSYQPPENPDGPHWRYALAPPPGKEFATIEFACDIEQLKERSGGHLNCFILTGADRLAVKGLGGVGWPGRDKPGRRVVRRKIAIPPGVKIVHIETGSWKDRFHIRSVEATASFRDARKGAAAPRADAWVSVSVSPKGGKLTCGDRTLTDGVAQSGFPPGKYTVRYEVPGRTDKFETELLVEPGRRYAIRVDLDSPFRWRQGPARDMGPIPPGRASIRRLPDGTWICTWCTWGKKIMTSVSKDLVSWSPAAPAAFNSVFENCSPATMVAEDGTLWLAVFSKRVSLENTTTGGYRMFLTSTRDGRKWAPLRAVSIPQVDGTPVGSACMFRAPDKQYWIYFGPYAASAKSLAEIRELVPIRVAAEEGTRPMTPRSPHVVVDPEGVFHMVFDRWVKGIYHTTSADGINWDVPTTIVQRTPRGGLSDPQLILAGGKALLLYGAYLTPVRLDGDPAKAGDGLEVTSHTNPLHGSRMTLTADGQVLLTVGGQTSWLLRAKLEDLLKIKGAE